MAAKLLRVSRSELWKWENGTRRIPAERANWIWTITGIARHKLRPDVFEEAEETEAAA
jgi:DNA-binding transcriptional regulator YdaS (Cro superfamily)